MRPLALLAAGLFAGSAFADDKKDDPKKDEKKVKDEEAILGTWKTEKYDTGGVDDPCAESRLKTQLTFSKGGKMLWAAPGVEHKGEYTLDPTAKPKTMDLSNERGTAAAIYALDGDTLTIAFTVKGGADRPEELKAGEKDGKAVAVMTLKRVKDEKKDK